MDNIPNLETPKRQNKWMSDKRVTTFIAFFSIIEFLEVWGSGWTLLTLLSPEVFPNLWKVNETMFEDEARGFHDITNREQYANCVIAYLAFYVVFLLSSTSLLWGNWFIKVTPFLMYQGCSALSLLLTVIVSTYFLVQEHANVFLFVSDPDAESSLYTPYLLLFLYFSRYFYLGWIIKIGFILCSGQRRRDIESEKDVDVQVEVDKAFKNVFESEPAKDKSSQKGADSHGRRRMEHYGEPDDSMYDRPPSVPEFVQKIPRIRLSHAGGEQPATGTASAPGSAYVNGGFRHDQVGRLQSPDKGDLYSIPSRTHAQRDENVPPPQRRQYEDDSVVYMKRNANRDPGDYAVVDLRREHRRSRSDGREEAYLNEGYQHDDERPPDPAIELRRFPRSRDIDNIGKKRPRSSYSLRDSSFAYGPGPRGYNVPSPLSVAADGPGVSLTREESLVHRLSAHYDESAGLRTGPAPTGGVPAIGPASIRRYPPRSPVARHY